MLIHEVKMARRTTGFLSAFDSASQIFQALAKEVMEIGGSDADLRSLLTDKAKRRRVAEAIHGGRATGGACAHRSGVYIIPVDYGPNPSKTQLELEEFSGEGTVSEMFDGRPWNKHCSCTSMDETNAKRTMSLFWFDDYMESADVITCINSKGFRPATEKEARAFAKACPDEQREFSIVALGAFAIRDARQHVAVLYGDVEGRYLRSGWVGHKWSQRYRFLAVRKEQSDF